MWYLQFLYLQIRAKPCSRYLCTSFKNKIHYKFLKEIPRVTDQNVMLTICCR